MNILSILLQVQDTVIQYVAKTVDPATTATQFDWTSIIGILLGSGSVIYLIVQTILKQRDKRIDGELERGKEILKHDNTLDLKKLDIERENQLQIQADNEAFQKQIINEIFSKYVKQNDWITGIYERKFEELLGYLTELKREVKELRILSDKMNLHIKNVDDRVIKNTNIIIAKTDALLKVFANVSFSCVKDTLKTLPKQEKDILLRNSEEIKINTE